MPQDTIITLQLPANYVGQTLDGLEVLIEQWEATQHYHETGVVREGVFIRECNDAHEAASIARFYREIKSRIEEQYRAQRDR